jgi:hypothetical protein
MDFWPDLRSAVNGAKDQFAAFYAVANQVTKQISGTKDHCHGQERVLTSANASLVSIPAFYKDISDVMDASTVRLVREAPQPSMQLLHISLCPRHSTRSTTFDVFSSHVLFKVQP